MTSPSVMALSGNALFHVHKRVLPILPSSDIPSMGSSGNIVRTRLYSVRCVRLAVACSWDFSSFLCLFGFFFLSIKSVHTTHLCIVYFSMPSVHHCSTEGTWL